MKKRIQLTESDIRSIVKNVINEVSFYNSQMAMLKADDLGRKEQADNINNLSVDSFNKDYSFFQDDKGGRFQLCYSGGLCYFKTQDASKTPLWRANHSNKDQGLQIANSLRAKFRNKMLRGIETYYKFYDAIKTNLKSGRKAYEDEVSENRKKSVKEA